MTFTVEAILAVLFVVVLMNIFKRHPQLPATPSYPQPDLANLRPTDARAGDVISVAGAGDNMSDLDFTADRYLSCRAGSRTWIEVSGMYRERRVAMRVENAEDVEVWLRTDPRKLTIQDLGLSEEDLAEMDERQNPADSFGFDNSDWLWRQSTEATASRSDQAGGYPQQESLLLGIPRTERQRTAGCAQAAGRALLRQPVPPDSRSRCDDLPEIVSHEPGRFKSRRRYPGDRAGCGAVPRPRCPAARSAPPDR